MLAKRPYSFPRLRFHNWFPAKSKAARSPVAKIANTLLPSVTGDGEAMLLRPLVRSPSATIFCQRTLPFFASRHNSARFFSASGLETKTESPQTTGVAPLGPGMGVTQATPFVLLQFSGRPVSVVEPLNAGPRQWPQFSAYNPWGKPSAAVKRPRPAQCRKLFEKTFILFDSRPPVIPASHTNLTPAKQGGFTRGLFLSAPNLPILPGGRGHGSGRALEPAGGFGFQLPSQFFGADAAEVDVGRFPAHPVEQ